MAELMEEERQAALEEIAELEEGGQSLNAMLNTEQALEEQKAEINSCKKQIKDRIRRLCVKLDPVLQQQVKEQNWERQQRHRDWDAP